MTAMRAQPMLCRWGYLRGVDAIKECHISSWLQDAGATTAKDECDSLVTLYGRAKSWWPAPVDAAPVGGRLISPGALARICSLRDWCAQVLTERRRKASDSRFFESFRPAWVTALSRLESSHPRMFGCRNVNKRSIPSCRMNQFHCQRNQ